METEREKAVYLTKLAEQAKRYADMVESIKKVCEINADLSLDERSLLSVGYKNTVAICRSSRQVILEYEQREEEEGNTELLNQIMGYRQKIEVEQENICKDAINLIEKYLVPQSGSLEAMVFYYKMMGDYLRYLAEIKAGDERKNIADDSVMWYESAAFIAMELAPTHPVRLGLALNFSVFDDDKRQIIIEQHQSEGLPYDKAISEMESFSEDTYRESFMNMTLMKDVRNCDWSNFPVEIIKLLQIQLRSMDDFVRSHAVCKAWNSSSEYNDLPEQFPLIFQRQSHNSRLQFYSLTTGKMHYVACPVSSGMCLGGLYNGYMIAEGSRAGDKLTGYTTLINPLTKHEIPLPTCDNEQYPSWRAFTETLLDDYVVKIAVKTDKVAAIAVNGIRENDWVEMDMETSGVHYQYFSIGKMIYAINIQTGSTTVYDISTKAKAYTVPTTEEHWYWSWKNKIYVIKGATDIYLVLLSVEPIEQGLSVVPRIQKIHKLNINNKSWEKVDDIGNQAFFLDRSKGFSVNSSKQAKIEPNSVYYMERGHVVVIDVKSRGMRRMRNILRESETRWYLPKLGYLAC